MSTPALERKYLIYLCENGLFGEEYTGPEDIPFGVWQERHIPTVVWEAVYRMEGLRGDAAYGFWSIIGNVVAVIVSDAPISAHIQLRDLYV